MTSLLEKYAGDTDQTHLLEHPTDIGGGKPDDSVSEDEQEDDELTKFASMVVSAGSEEPDPILFMDPIGGEIDSEQVLKMKDKFVIKPDFLSAKVKKHTKGGNSFRDALATGGAEESEEESEEEFEEPKRREINVGGSISKYVSGGMPPKDPTKYTGGAAEEEHGEESEESDEDK
jgi:hypothetical protein